MAKEITKNESKCSKDCTACKGMHAIESAKMCPVKSFTFGVPSCFSEYDENKEFCKKVCKYSSECK